jgi:hypothetical protein
VLGALCNGTLSVFGLTHAAQRYPQAAAIQQRGCRAACHRLVDTATIKQPRHHITETVGVAADAQVRFIVHLIADQRD